MLPMLRPSGCSCPSNFGRKSSQQRSRLPSARFFFLDPPTRLAVKKAGTENALWARLGLHSLGICKFSTTASQSSSTVQQGPLTLAHQSDNGVIGYLTLNNPKKRNALSFQMLSELHEQLEKMANSKTIRVVILRASGPVFSAGHDLKEIDSTKADPVFHTKLFNKCTQVMEAIRKLPQPVIASVNGLATAAGCQLAATCDLIVASKKSGFQTPGVKVGLFCTTPAVAVARNMHSIKKTMEMLLTGDALTADEALTYGLVNKVVAEEDLEAETNKLAQKIADTPTTIVSLGKKAFYDQIAMPVTNAYHLAEQCMVDNLRLKEGQEGISAFVEKRKPNW